MSYLGIDIGTSGSKVIAFDIEGKQIAEASREYPLIKDQPDWAELDAQQIIDHCFAMIKEVASKTKHDPISGLGISCQGEAFTAVDKNGKIVCNAMVSSDLRAKNIAQKWNEEFGGKKLYEITGHTAHPLFTLFKLEWVRDNRPEIWNSAEKILCFEDLLLFKLGIDPAISYSLAGRTLLFDIRQEKWNDEILNKLGLDKNKLAKPLPSGTIAGKIPKHIAEQLGLQPDVIAVVGGHDQPCATMGAGINKAGVSMYALGTVVCVAPVFDKPVFKEDLYKNNICTYHHVVPGQYISLGYNLTGGNMLQWCRDQLAREEKQIALQEGKNAYDIMLENIPEQPTSLLTLPYFHSSGTPYFETELGGAILGLRSSTTKEDIIKALLEGMTMEMRLNLNIMEDAGISIKHLHMTGGGAKNRKLVQLKADVLGLPVSTLKVTEAGCLGVAMLACAAHKQLSITELIRNWVKIVSVVEPHTERARVYSEKFNTYKKLYPVLKKL